MSGRRTAFVAMPFSSDFDNVYDLCIKPACEANDVKPVRLDKEYVYDDMLDAICTQIENCDFVITDLSGDNPNVFFEVGYAFAKSKIIIYLKNSSEKTPFDLGHRQMIQYENEALKTLADNLQGRINHLCTKLDSGELNANIPSDKIDSKNQSDSNTDNAILTYIMRDVEEEIEQLFEKQLWIFRDEISNKTKRTIIEYLFRRWERNPSFSGIVKPIRWLNRYFDLIQPENYHYLMLIINEATTTSLYSYDAEDACNELVKKIKPEMLVESKRKFLWLCASARTDLRNKETVTALLEGMDALNVFDDQEKEAVRCMIILHKEGISPETNTEYETVERFLSFMMSNP